MHGAQQASTRNRSSWHEPRGARTASIAETNGRIGHNRGSCPVALSLDNRVAPCECRTGAGMPGAGDRKDERYPGLLSWKVERRRASVDWVPGWIGQ